jgi:hypothetical protein
MEAIDSMKLAILRQMGLAELAPKLADYKVAGELPDLKLGAYLRWIHVDRGKLTNGAHLVAVNLNEEGIYLNVRGGGRFFTIKFDDCIVFQKLGTDERIVLHAMDVANRN